MDGYFASGPLAGRTVNIKKYSTDDGLLDIKNDALPDFFLVLTGPRTSPASSRGTTQPWTIESIFLFEAGQLAKQLSKRDVKIGTSASVIRRHRDDAVIYPSPRNPALQLTPEQISMVELFSHSS